MKPQTNSTIKLIMLEILADHLNASQPEQAPMEEAA